jgi:hypothetical protein
MNRSLRIISEIPANKAGIKLFADAVVDGVMSGEADPLDVRAKIDAIEKIIKAIKDDVAFKDAVLIGLNWPLTSVRRAMTDLTSERQLLKTEQMKPGYFGKPEHIWVLHPTKDSINPTLF